MNSIVFTHFAVPSASAGALDVALHRLGAWLDTERETLGRVLTQAGRRGACRILDMMDQLHLDGDAMPHELREVLEEARDTLAALLETLREIPTCCRLETAWGLPGPDTFDRHVRWSGARLEDIVATLNRALAA
ncbi:hypothetical protein SAMN05444413_11249 [Roseivivax marinus]|uniref:hypothetical protein n=1 Tax=Roseivivax marinus TaxID=1379903 RepID=UPI0008C8414D|nr:hypothetical protein [Roseivivax marinus]SEL62938.1 hypothetical protein SAMN05444413_11249 [Roseivivax marinus]